MLKCKMCERPAMAGNNFCEVCYVNVITAVKAGGPVKKPKIDTRKNIAIAGIWIGFSAMVFSPLAFSSKVSLEALIAMVLIAAFAGCAALLSTFIVCLMGLNK